MRRFTRYSELPAPSSSARSAQYYYASADNAGHTASESARFPVGLNVTLDLMNVVVPSHTTAIRRQIPRGDSRCSGPTSFRRRAEYQKINGCSSSLFRAVAALETVVRCATSCRRIDATPRKGIMPKVTELNTENNARVTQFT